MKTLRCCAAGRCRILAGLLRQEAQQRLGPFGVMGAIEDGKGAGLVRVRQLLRPHRQCDVTQSGAQMGAGEVEGGRSTGTCVLDVDDRNAIQSCLAQCHLTTDHVLPLQQRLADVGKERRTHLVGRRTSVGQGEIDGLAGHRAQRNIRETTRGRAAHAHDVERSRHLSPLLPQPRSAVLRDGSCCAAYRCPALRVR